MPRLDELVVRSYTFIASSQTGIECQLDMLRGGDKSYTRICDAAVIARPCCEQMFPRRWKKSECTRSRQRTPVAYFDSREVWSSACGANTYPMYLVLCSSEGSFGSSRIDRDCRVISYILGRLSLAGKHSWLSHAVNQMLVRSKLLSLSSLKPNQKNESS